MRKFRLDFANSVNGLDQRIYKFFTDESQAITYASKFAKENGYIFYWTFKCV